MLILCKLYYFIKLLQFRIVVMILDFQLYVYVGEGHKFILASFTLIVVRTLNRYRLLQNVLVSREVSLICTVLYTEVLKINKLLIINLEN